MLIAQLELATAERPLWYNPAYSAQIPLPHLDIQPLPGEILVWGYGQTHGQTHKIPLLSRHHTTLHSQYDWESWQTWVLGEEYRTLHQPFYTRLPFHYHAIPGWIRALAASGLFWLRNPGFNPPAFPGFPIEQGWELLQHWLNPAPRPPSRVILTHDIDSAAGWDWVKPLAELEMRYGFRSVWHMVGHKYPLNPAILDWLVEHDFKLGLHGYNHDGRLIFLTEAQIRQRLEQCLPLIQRYQMDSFRSPAWFRNRKLYRVLADYFQVDYSPLDTDIICPGGNGGCFTSKAFTLDGLLHIPTTLPFEEPLRFGCPPHRLLEFWQPKLDWLYANRGDIVVNTHPEPHFSGNPGALATYEQLLKVLNERT